MLISLYIPIIDFLDTCWLFVMSVERRNVRLKTLQFQTTKITDKY